MPCMSTTSTTTKTTTRRSSTPGLHLLDTPAGPITFAKVNMMGAGVTWGYTAPGGSTVVEWGFGTLAEAAAHAGSAR